ncbi:MAG: MBL fold metallo-hydrolase [Anaerolineae bacterium]|nr:MBL fold metallo-hydrolase [Anaerolineae bacterium]
MLEVTFLGTGAALPMRGGTNSAYLIRTDNACILFDCGPAIFQQLDAVGMHPSDLTQVFISHRHGDHALGFPMLVLAWALGLPPGQALPTIITSELTWGSLEIVIKNSYGDDVAVNCLQKLPRILLPHDAESQLAVADGVKLHTYPMNHSVFAPVLGGRFEIGDKVVAFTADTTPNDNIVPLAQNADLLVHEANFSAILQPELAQGGYGHSTAQIAGRNASAAHAKRLAMVHLGAHLAGKESVMIEEAKREFDGGVSVPVAGVTYAL